MSLPSAYPMILLCASNSHFDQFEFPIMIFKFWIDTDISGDSDTGYWPESNDLNSILALLVSNH